MMDLTSVVTLVGIVQGIFILVLMALNKKNHAPAKGAMLLMTVFVVDLLTFFLHKNGWLNQLWFLRGLSEVTLFLYGPILYFYISSILDIPPISAKRKVYHFIPAASVLVLTSPIFLAQTTYSYLAQWEQQIPIAFGNYKLGTLLFDHVIWYVHGLLYFVLCLRLIQHFRKNHQNNLSVANQKARKIHVKWVKYLVSGYLIFPTVSLSILSYNLFLNRSADYFSLLNTFLVFHIFGISYIGFTNQKLLLNPLGLLKYAQSRLDNTTMEMYLTRVQDYFESKSPYLNVNLSLKMVANELELNPNHLSQVINQHYGHGFNDFVNHYRIELAKKHIIAPEKRIYTLEAIANEVGFKSKPTFNTAFKKKEGITPSEFRRAKAKL